MPYDELSVFNRSFWDLWIQKLLRNIASVKYQWLAFLYIPVVWGMFHIKPESKDPWISAALGLGFLGGGFITLATSRMIVRTKLMEDDEDRPYYKEAKKELKKEMKEEKAEKKKVEVAHKKAVKAEVKKKVAEARVRVARRNLEAYRDGLTDSDHINTDN